MATPDNRSQTAGLCWHPALAFAVTGEPMNDLGRQARPDVRALAPIICARVEGGQAGLATRVTERRAAGDRWPYPIPDELRTGLGAAQLHAALNQLIELLELDVPPTGTQSNRPPNADERRLLAEVPPHHGH